MSKSQQLRDEFGSDAIRYHALKELTDNHAPSAEVKFWTGVLDALIAEVRKEALEEACRAACWKCEAKTPVVNHRGDWVHIDGGCDAHYIHELLRKESK